MQGRMRDRVAVFRWRPSHAGAALQRNIQAERKQQPRALGAEYSVVAISRLTAVHRGQASHVLVHGAGLGPAVRGFASLCRVRKLPQAGCAAVFFGRLSMTCQRLRLKR